MNMSTIYDILFRIFQLALSILTLLLLLSYPLMESKSAGNIVKPNNSSKTRFQLLDVYRLICLCGFVALYIYLCIVVPRLVRIFAFIFYFSIALNFVASAFSKKETNLSKTEFLRLVKVSSIGITFFSFFIKSAISMIPPGYPMILSLLLATFQLFVYISIFSIDVCVLLNNCIIAISKKRERDGKIFPPNFEQPWDFLNLFPLTKKQQSREKKWIRIVLLFLCFVPDMLFSLINVTLSVLGYIFHEFIASIYSCTIRPIIVFLKVMKVRAFIRFSFIASLLISFSTMQIFVIYSDSISSASKEAFGYIVAVVCIPVLIVLLFNASKRLKE